jgi:hypothetical protein
MKTPSPVPTAAPGDKAALVGAYEELRQRFLDRQHGPGVALLMRSGLREWECLFVVPRGAGDLSTSLTR